MRNSHVVRKDFFRDAQIETRKETQHFAFRQRNVPALHSRLFLIQKFDVPLKCRIKAGKYFRTKAKSAWAFSIPTIQLISLPSFTIISKHPALLCDKYTADLCFSGNISRYRWSFPLPILLSPHLSGQSLAGGLVIFRGLLGKML